MHPSVMQERTFRGEVPRLAETLFAVAGAELPGTTVPHGRFSGLNSGLGSEESSLGGSLDETVGSKRSRWVRESSAERKTHRSPSIRDNASRDAANFSFGVAKTPPVPKCLSHRSASRLALAALKSANPVVFQPADSVVLVRAWSERCTPR